MAFNHTNVTVGTTPTILFTVPSGLAYTAVQICNNHTAPLYLGDISVAVSGATRGNQLASNASVQIWLNAGDTIYGVTAAATATGAISIIYSA
jgi:uncharacterized membrane protein YjjB (DUF3815 family)